MVNIGIHTYGADKLKIFYKRSGDLTIGKYCSIAKGCRIFLGGNHRGEWISTFPMIKQSSYTKGDVIIGNDVWIGYGVTILSGVTIGDGAIIGAMSVVTKDIEPYVIACGNPATIKKHRFEQGAIEKLLDIEWWNRGDSFIAGATKYLMSPDIDGFLKYAERANG